MSDVDTWSPVDESNTSPPPDGWPEFMLPSAVNNCGRAMMGAVRRLYDKQVDGSLVLPYLKLAGGSGQTVTGGVTFSGGLTTTSVNASGNVSAGSLSVSGGVTVSAGVNAGVYQLGGTNFGSRSGADTWIYDSTGQWTINTQSTGNNWYANTTHFFGSRNAAATFASISGGGLTVTATGDGAISAPNGGITVGTAFVSNRAAGQLGLSIPNANASIGGTLLATGGLYTNGAVTAAQGLRFDASGTLGTITADGAGIHSDRALVLPNGIKYAGGNSHSFGWDATNLQVVIDGSYVFSIFPSSSDERLKSNIGPSQVDALSLIGRVNTIAYDRQGRHYEVGVSAQQLEKLMPEAILTGPADAKIPGQLQVDPFVLSTYLLRALQQLADKVDALGGTDV